MRLYFNKTEHHWPHKIRSTNWEVQELSPYSHISHAGDSHVLLPLPHQRALAPKPRLPIAAGPYYPPHSEEAVCMSPSRQGKVCGQCCSVRLACTRTCLQDSATLFLPYQKSRRVKVSEDVQKDRREGRPGGGGQPLADRIHPGSRVWIPSHMGLRALQLLCGKKIRVANESS